MSDSVHIATPDETVAEKIIARLVKARFITDHDKKRTWAKLANGSLKAEDWRLLAEKALEAAVREGIYDR